MLTFRFYLNLIYFNVMANTKALAALVTVRVIVYVRTPISSDCCDF